MTKKQQERKIVSPYLKNEIIEPRDYQVNISNEASKKSSLVVLPTGMGKTIIGFYVMAKTLEKHPEDKILMMAPTKPLVNQHAKDIKSLMNVDEPEVLTGEVRPKDRETLWDNSQIIVSTPQVIKNDLDNGRIGFDDTSLVLFDETHRATGDYSYVEIGEKFQETDGLSLGLTASPGSDIDDILNICEKLGFEHVEIRNKYDPDMVNYTNMLEKKFIKVELTDNQRKIVDKLKEISEELIKKLQGYGILKNKSPSNIYRKHLIEASNKIRGELNKDNPRSVFYHAISVVTAAIKLDHAIAMAETQGPVLLYEYLRDVIDEAESNGGTKASKTLCEKLYKKDIPDILENFNENHPKVGKVAEVVSNQIETDPESRVIVFTNYRRTASKVTERLHSIEGVRPVRFIGQANKSGDKGLKQEEQIETIDDFEEGTHNVLVATSVGEEGLDIPATDLVVFYEPVPSEVRTIQRRGRTARKSKGKMIMLITKDTRDEAHYWASKNKEKRMQKNLTYLRDKLEDKISVGDPLDIDLDDIHEVEKDDRSQEDETSEKNDYVNTEEKEQQSLVDFM